MTTKIFEVKECRDCPHCKEIEHHFDWMSSVMHFWYWCGLSKVVFEVEQHQMLMHSFKVEPRGFCELNNLGGA